MTAIKSASVPFPDDLAERLNPQQRQAVRHGEGPLLVVAGAGTGKTRVITERIRWLLESNPELPGEAILGLTFTDKAAGEMKHRVAQAVGERGKKVWLSTFHSFCLNGILLPANPGWKALDNIDHWILLRRNLPLLKLDRYRRLADPGQFLGDFVQFFSRCQDELVTPDDYERYAGELAARYEREKARLEPDEQRLRAEEVARQQEIARVYRTSDALLRERNLLTFGAQLLESVHQLKNNPELLAELRARYRYILVDEFQDTNIAQIELLWLLAGEHRNIFAVGDNDQAIYRFRGASFGSFLIFLEKFSGARASSDAAQHIRPLTINYRSAARILRVAGQVIAQNEKSRLFPAKDLTTPHPEGEKIRIVELGSPAEEAQWVARELERLHRTGRHWRDFAVLYRMHTHRDHLVQTLAARKIPFVIRNLSILNNTLVRDVIAYLRLIAAPSDNIACARVLAAPGWGLEPRELVRLCERAAKNRGTPLWDALQAAQGELPFSGDAKRTADLVALITGLRKRMRRESASAVLDALAAELGVSVVTAAADRKYFDRFVKFVREWELKSETQQLPEFVEYVDYFEQAGGQINLDDEAPEDAVQLMTVHAAKGLEFDHVFVIRLVRGGFPASPRPHVLEFPAELMKEARPEGDFHIQEERRLFYVALTRAQRRLTLTTVVHKRSKPSVFLDDILLNPQIAHGDVQQLAPKAPRANEAAADPAVAPPAEAPLFVAERERARIYSQIARWAANFHPAVSEPLQLSASAIDTYLACPQKYLLGRIWGIPGAPHAATSFGNVMHTTIKHFIGELRKGRPMPFDEVEAIFQREWSSAGFEDSYQEAEYKKDGLDQLRAFHAATTAAPPTVLAQEKAFELAMDANVVVTGRMDQVNRLAPGQEEIVDYKTGKPKAEAQAKKDLQLSLYALAAREALDLNPGRLTFYNLATNEAVTTTRDEKQLRAAQETVQEVAADIRAGQFAPKPGFLCKSCEFQPLCPAHEQLVTIQPAAM